jgi:ElaB/YqjD/DUF883 family membrane-anchored ribosome-binding protein
MSDDLRKKAEARYAEARDKVSDAVSTGKAKAEDAIKTARTKADDAYRTARTQAEKAATATRANASAAAQKTAETFDQNPLFAVVGGLALGAIAAALLPKTRREEDLLGKTGDRIRSTTSKAARAARDAGKDQLDAFGLNADAAKDQLRNLVEKLGDAAKSATNAAADSVRKK